MFPRSTRNLIWIALDCFNAFQLLCDINQEATEQENRASKTSFVQFLTLRFKLLYFASGLIVGILTNASLFFAKLPDPSSCPQQNNSFCSLEENYRRVLHDKVSIDFELDAMQNNNNLLCCGNGRIMFFFFSLRDLCYVVSSPTETCCFPRLGYASLSTPSGAGKMFWPWWRIKCNFALAPFSGEVWYQ